MVVPTITLNDTYLKQLGHFIGGLDNLKALDVLPYHTMGEVKYENLGIDYPLKGIPAATKEQAIHAKTGDFRGHQGTDSGRYSQEVKDLHADRMQ